MAKQKANKEVKGAESKAPETTETQKPKVKKAKPVYVVKIAFKDAPQYAKTGQANEYMEGADVSDLDAERLNNLVERGIVDKIG